MINDLIKWLYEQGLSGIIYTAFTVMGFVGVLLFNLWYGPKYGISKRKSALVTIITYIILYTWMLVYFWIENHFTNFGGNNIVRVFVYLPLVLLLVAKIFKLDWAKTCDFIAPSPCVIHGIAHWGCIFAGCCQGYFSRFGIYNPVHQSTLFPNQPIEAIVAIMIIVVLVGRAKSIKYKVDGLQIPIMLMLFGFTRFIMEFARDNRKLCFGISSLAFHALFMAVVGTIAYVIIKRRNSAKPEIVEEPLLNSENK